MKQVLLFVPGVVALALIGIGLYQIIGDEREDPSSPLSIVVPGPTGPIDPMNATYIIEDHPIRLVDGSFTGPSAPGSVSAEIFRVFGEPEYGDLDGDGDDDAAVYLTRSGGGSGTFFYVALALQEDEQYFGTNALYLGDRIAPQDMNIIDGRAVANFADRNPGESFDIPPSRGESVWVHLDPQTGNIGEFVKDFEGEADPSVMTLSMKKWVWQGSVEDGVAFTPKRADAFMLTFDAEKVSATTDCNTMGGTYTATGAELTLGPLSATKMYCEGSEEQVFAEMLSRVRAYTFTGKGELILSFGEDGTATFR